MSGTNQSVMGDRGRIVVPADIRERMHLEKGTPLIFHETDDGLMILTREQAIRRLRAQLPKGASVVDELLAEHREDARRENAES
jgi:AbrB family looped-hinge helix DNA binding protein